MKLPLNALSPHMIEAVAALEDISGVPVELTAPIALTVAAYAVQGLYDVDPVLFSKRELMIYSIGVAGSGSLKSELFKFLCGGIDRYQNERMAGFDKAIAEYNAKMESWRIEVANAKKEKNAAIRERALTDLLTNEPVRPLSPNRSMDSVTAVGLLKRLAKTEPSTIIMSPDAGSFFGGHGFKSDDVKLQFAANLAKLWNAEMVDRNTSEEEFALRNHRLSIMMLVQEEAVRDFVGSALFEKQGLTARFLISRCPDFETTVVDLLDEEAMRERQRKSIRLNAFNNRVYQLLSKGLKLENGVLEELPVMRMTRDALVLFNDFQMHEARALQRQNDHPFFRRMVEHCARIAAVMAAFEGEGEISAERMSGAIDLTRYFANEWAEIDTSPDAAYSTEKPVIDRIVKWAQKKGSFTKRDLDKSGPNIWRTADKRLRESVMSRMIENGDLKAVEAVAGNGKTVVTYTVE